VAKLTSEAFWAAAKRAAEEVKTWPQWKQDAVALFPTGTTQREAAKVVSSSELIADRTTHDHAGDPCPHDSPCWPPLLHGGR
jgi:hypothetical protein